MSLSSTRKTISFEQKRFLFSILLVVISYFTYVENYWHPDGLFWDEPYHVSSAQKYLNNIFFMEQHPPFGKMMIALGEYIFNANNVNSQFITTDFAENIPAGFSMAGYRFFPVVAGWASVILVFFIILKLSSNLTISFFLSFLIAFDNALIAHTRSAMLESLLIFFLLALTLVSLNFIEAIKNRANHLKLYTLGTSAGILLGLAVATKLTGLIGALLVVMVWWHLRNRMPLFVKISLTALLSSLLTFLIIFSIHFFNAEKIEPGLDREGFYGSNPETVEKFLSDKSGNLDAIPELIVDSLKYTLYYNRHVSAFNLCKDRENGSPAYMWPVGARTIKYIWQEHSDNDSQYIILQSNPVVWFSILAAVLLSLVICIGPVIAKTSQASLPSIQLVTFVLIYVLYMLVISQIDRVMYLYHYFPALVFGLVLLASVITHIDRIGKWHVSTTNKELFSLVLGLMVFASYQYYSPLTYYKQITKSQIEQRALIDLWDLRCGSCKLTNRFAAPIPDTENEK